MSGSTTSADEPAAHRRRRLPAWAEMLVLLGIVLLSVLLIRVFLLERYFIPSASMEPGLTADDQILVEKPSYWFGHPERGDVVVFEDPGGWLTAADTPPPTGLAGVLADIGLYPTGGHLVKRVIGVEGDVIECCDDQGHLVVNGVPVDESAYLTAKHGRCAASQPGAGCDWTIGPIPEDQLFVLGDNRQNSADSRFHVCRLDDVPCDDTPWVDEDLVVGKVFALIWPRDRWDWISRPAVFDDVPDDPPTE